jgi:hypothetical protein
MGSYRFSIVCGSSPVLLRQESHFASLPKVILTRLKLLVPRKFQDLRLGGIRVQNLRGWSCLICNFAELLQKNLNLVQQFQKCPCRSILNLAKKYITNYFLPLHQKVQYRTRWHFQNCKIYLLPDGISNSAPIFTNHVTVLCQSFKTSLFWSGDWTILERQITDDFSQFQSSKSISSEDIFAKRLKFLSIILQNKRLRHVFVQFPAKTWNMIFLVIFEKKSASIFSKVGSKESQWNTYEKSIFWSFSGQIRANVIF